MRGVLYCRPSDIPTSTATITLTAGAANAAYPLVNAYDKNPAKPFKATGTGCTIRFVWSVAQTLEAFAIITHNLVGASVTLTNNAGLSQSFGTIPSDAEDGLSVDPWLDLRSLINATATQWNLVITGASANVAIGEVLPIASLRDLLVLPKPEEAEDMPAIQHEATRDSTLVYALGVRRRRFLGQLLDEQDRLDVLSLRRDALGVSKGFAFMPDEDENECLFMQFRDPSVSWQRWTPEVADAMTIDLWEVGRGPGV